MSNYHHDQIQKLEDFRNCNFIINPKSNIKKHILGSAKGGEKYERPEKDRHMGPIVMGDDRYDAYYVQQPATYGTPVVVKEESAMERCCACLGKTLCCLCLCDMLT